MTEFMTGLFFVLALVVIMLTIFSFYFLSCWIFLRYVKYSPLDRKTSKLLQEDIVRRVVCGKSVTPTYKDGCYQFALSSEKYELMSVKISYMGPATVNFVERKNIVSSQSPKSFNIIQSFKINLEFLRRKRRLRNKEEKEEKESFQDFAVEAYTEDI